MNEIPGDTKGFCKISFAYLCKNICCRIFFYSFRIMFRTIAFYPFLYLFILFYFVLIIFSVHGVLNLKTIQQDMHGILSGFGLSRNRLYIPLTFLYQAALVYARFILLNTFLFWFNSSSKS